MNNYILKAKLFPIGAVGTSLGFMTLANVWAIHGVTFLKPIAIIFAICALSLLTVKVLVHPKQTWSEMKNPILGGFYPTIDMALFVLMGYLLPYLPSVAKAIWLIGIAFHLVYFAVFFGSRIKGFKMRHMLPSWNIVLVGVCVASVGSKGMGFPHIAEFLTWFGIVCYLPFYPFMLYRVYVHKHKIEVPAAATIGIMAAPSSLVLASYLTTNTTHNAFILWYLILTSIFNIVMVYIEIPKFIKQGFKAGYAAFTFPLAISMLAMWKTGLLMEKAGSSLAIVFKTISDVELILGSLVIGYVAINFIILLVKAIIEKEEEIIKEHKEHKKHDSQSNIADLKKGM
ncbi:MAG: TDT family transporter [Sarcina sp.]